MRATRPAGISRSGSRRGGRASAVSVTFPVKVGLSLKDYYELAGVDHKFGYASVAGLVTVPLGGVTSFGSWNIHGGVEFQLLGDTTKAINGGDRSEGDRLVRHRHLVLV